ncbi:MAG TPA: DUF167 family protein [Thermodesulfovibrio thiophilus]|nr:phosphatase PAP2 family protein [Thermodesulfovibrio thiophilus]HOA82784.1 DUF167 family protein [Thermodesulfovibrio thiophilus]HQA03526.1 DUF167 family protein [Thermodesulfovibrio thiophilus]
MIMKFFKIQPAFQLNIIFFTAMCIVLLIFSDKLPSISNFLVIYASIVLFQFCICNIKENVFLTFIRDIGLPVLSVLIAFDTVGELIPLLNPDDIDRELLKLDYSILGFYPYVAFEKIASPLLTELMQISYCFYYALPFLLGYYLIKKGQKIVFYRALFIVIFCYYLSYIGYMIFPALGPRYSMPGMFQQELNGVFLANTIRDFLNYLEGIKRDAFPSGHVGISLVILFLMLKYSRKLFWISLVPVLFLIISTIYCRYHYFSDVLGGIFLAVVSLVAGNLYYNFWLKKMGIPFLKDKDGYKLKVLVKTGSKMPGVEGIEEDTLQIKLRAQPHDGLANKELIELLSELLHIPKSRLEIAKGRTSRQKVVRIKGEIA